MPFHLNEIVWAKIRGFPFWPARIVEPDDVGIDKIPKKKNLYCVTFINASGADGGQVGWCGDGEIMEWTSNLVTMKDAARDKGGKAYTDLRVCIDLGDEAHKEYVQELNKNPNAFREVFAINSHEPTTPAAGEPSSAKPRNKTGPKPKTPLATSHRIGSAKKEKLNGTTGSEPEPTDSQVVAPRSIKIKPMPEQPGEESEEPNTSSSGNGRSKRISKKRILEDEELPAKVPKKAIKAEPKSISILNKPEVGRSSGKEARDIHVGFIGLEDVRTKHVAKLLLDSGVTVSVWSKEVSLTKDLEYSLANPISEPEKMFDDTDVVFVSASNSWELHQLLTGADHLISRIRPQGKNKVKGVCVFGAVSRAESAALGRKLEAKNILYLESSWIGTENELTFVGARSRKLYDQISPILDIIVEKKRSFIGEDFGQALVAGAAAAIAHNVALAGMVEAACLAQQNDLPFDLIASLIAPTGSGHLIAKCQQIVDFKHAKKDATTLLLKQGYSGLRDAIHIAHPSHGPSSITPLTSMTLDMFKTQFATYRYEREQDEVYVENRVDAMDHDGLKEGNGVGSDFSETSSNTASGKEKSGITNGVPEGKGMMNGVEAEVNLEEDVVAE